VKRRIDFPVDTGWGKSHKLISLFMVDDFLTPG
jgi:hypothetical protein